LNPDYAEILSAFSTESVEYLVVGAFALAAHGAPRTTGHIDFWVNPDPANVERLWRALLRFGAPLERLSPQDFHKPDIVFQMGAPPARIDLLTSIDGVAWNDAWSTHVVKNIQGLNLPVLSSDLLIRNKRSTGRPQDLVDADRLERRWARRRPS